MAQNIKSLEAVTLEISAKANPKGHLFAGVHKEQIVEELKKQARIEVLPAFITLDKPLKEVGNFIVEIKAHDKSAKLKIEVKSL